MSTTDPSSGDSIVVTESTESESSVVQPEPTIKPGDDAPEGTPGTGENVCPHCNGEGRDAEGNDCPVCGGTGKVNTGVGGG